MATGVIVPGPDVSTTTSAQRKMIVASTLGTTFSWYDFNLFAASYRRMLVTVGVRRLRVELLG